MTWRAEMLLNKINRYRSSFINDLHNDSYNFSDGLWKDSDAENNNGKYFKVSEDDEVLQDIKVKYKENPPKLLDYDPKILRDGKFSAKIK